MMFCWTHQSAGGEVVDTHGALFVSSSRQLRIRCSGVGRVHQQLRGDLQLTTEVSVAPRSAFSAPEPLLPQPFCRQRRAQAGASDTRWRILFVIALTQKNKTLPPPPKFSGIASFVGVLQQQQICAGKPSFSFLTPIVAESE